MPYVTNDTPMAGDRVKDESGKQGDGETVNMAKKKRYETTTRRPRQGCSLKGAIRQEESLPQS